MLCAVFLKSENVSSNQINSTKNAPILFFKSKFSTETVSYRLSLRMAWIDMDLNLKKLRKLFKVLMPYLQKSPQISWLVLPEEICFIPSS